jgi:hypothetical protein
MGAFEHQIAPVDFVADELLTCADVNALVAAITNGNDSARFDLTGDEIVDPADLNVWLSLAGSENLSSHRAYPLGDANLDGKVNADDLNVIGLNWLQAVTGWCIGDFTADGRVDARDLNALAINWNKDVLDPNAPVVQRVPRAPLANHVVAVIPAEPQDSLVVALEPKLSPGGINVESGTEYVSSSHVAESYVRRELRSSSTCITSHGDDFHERQDSGQTELVDLVFLRW